MCIKNQGQSELSALPTFKQLYMCKNESIQTSLSRLTNRFTYIMLMYYPSAREQERVWKPLPVQTQEHLERKWKYETAA